MTKEEIIEGSKLIAEFMGYVNVRSVKEYPSYRIPEHSYEVNTFDGNTETIDTFDLNWDLCFHSSWDWLMPVVEKCFQAYDSVEDNSSNHQFKLNDALIEINIFSLWKAVIEFITWYNQNK